MDTKNDKSETQRGEATERILSALTMLSPHSPSRHAFLNSAELANAHQKDTLSEAEKTNANKTIARLIRTGALTETLRLNGSSPTVNLPEEGIVAITVDIQGLNQNRRLKASGSKDSLLTSQEDIVKELIARAAQPASGEGQGRPAYLLRDIWVLHGSNLIDIMMIVSYRSTTEFLSFVRDVVQRVDCVRGTQTMQVSRDFQLITSSVEI